MASKQTRTLVELLKSAFDEMFDAVKGRVESKSGVVIDYPDYPVLNLRETGMPYFSTASKYSQRPPKLYTSVAGGGGLFGVFAGGLNHTFESEACSRLVDFVHKSRKHRTRFSDEEDDVVPDLDLIKYRVYGMIRDCVEHYIQKHGLEAVDPAKRSPILRRVFVWMERDQLPLAVMVPIALTSFDCRFLQLAPGVSILRMTKPMQLARSRINDDASSASERVLGAATHALVASGWTLENSSMRGVERALTLIPDGLQDLLDQFFASLRMITKASTGYSQVLYWPRQWTTRYYADLPPMYGTSVRRYPSAFDHYRWYAYDKVEVTKEELLQVRDLFRLFTTRNERSIKIAARRLNSCYVRDDTIDAILDATIGLEVLLSDKSKDAVAYKLRMRAAALASLGGTRNPAEVARTIGKLYDVRSSIVHGTEKYSKKVEDQESPFEEYRSTAADELGNVLEALLRAPEYLKPEAIDTKLLLATSIRKDSASG